MNKYKAYPKYKPSGIDWVGDIPETSVSKQKIKSAKDIVDILMPQLRDLKTEIFKVVYLDSNNRIIDIENAAIGTVNHAMPIVREIIHSVLA